MADPTLLADQPSYTGFTVDEIAERLLGARGMTLDADTGRVLATSSEQLDAYNRVRRAMSMLTARFPGVFTIQEHTATWTSGDTMYALPASCRSVVWASYEGRQLRPLTRLKRQDLVKSDENDGGFKITGTCLYYFMRGMSDEGVSPLTDYRHVIELIPNPISPQATESLVVGYNIKSWALPRADSDDGAKELPLSEPLQEWLLRRSQEIWGADASDQTTVGIAREERMVIEDDIHDMIEGTLEYPAAATPEYPTLPSESRDDPT